MLFSDKAYSSESSETLLPFLMFLAQISHPPLCSFAIPRGFPVFTLLPKLVKNFFRFKASIPSPSFQSLCICSSSTQMMFIWYLSALSCSNCFSSILHL